MAIPKSSNPPQHVTPNKKLSLSAKQPHFQQRPSSLTDLPPLAPCGRHAARQAPITHQSHALAPKATTPTTPLPPTLQTTSHHHTITNTIQTPNTDATQPLHPLHHSATLHLKNPQFAPKNPLTQATLGLSAPADRLRHSSQTALLRAKKKRTATNTGKQTFDLWISVEAERKVVRGVGRTRTVKRSEMNIHFGCTTNGWIYEAQSVS